MTPEWWLEIMKAAAASVELLDALKDNLGSRLHKSYTDASASSKMRRTACVVEQPQGNRQRRLSYRRTWRRRWMPSRP